jgi:hypothetical protein
LGLQKKKIYLDSMSILLILLSLESGCHNPSHSKTDVPVSQPQAKNVPLTTSVRPVSNILVPYVQLAAYASYRVPSLRSHASCIRTHVLDSYATVSFSTDPYALMN